MSDVKQMVSQLVSDLAPAERAMLLEVLGATVPAAAAAASEPVAVVGIGCRFPGGVVDPASLWRLLDARRDAVTEIPPSRFPLEPYYDADPDAPGKLYTRYGAFLDRVDTFDARFFDIAPREAVHLDPQQRILLEVAWEALEDAAQPVEALRRSRTGVFVGGCSHDYEQLQTRLGDVRDYDAHTLVGDLACVLAGRLSYSLGLEGPSLLVDTACSSSLVAIHLACQALHTGQASLALAGGVNVILSPDGYVKLSRMRALSPDGRCRAFDARANGYVRGEGAGVLVLKLLPDAVRDGDRIWAVIRGSAINHDGRSAGLTAPNGLAQRAVLRAALEAARVRPDQVGYIEAHGTGTPLGDPIELESLRDVFGGARPGGATCAVGSIKTNIGHAEAAAGVAGVIKAILALAHEQIPAHLHFDQLNPRISLGGSSLAIADRARPWPRGRQPRIAGVSSFGISGTNAHVVVEEAPAPAPRPAAPQRTSYVTTLSARTEDALAQLAARYAAALAAEPALELPDASITANTGRTRHAHRVALISRSRAELARQLGALAHPGAAAADGDDAIIRGVAGAVPSVAFVYPAACAGGPGWARLRDLEPAFRRAFEDICGDPRELGPAATVVATQLAVTALWRSWGIAPVAVTGEGAGELAAACTAGALSAADALAIAAGSRGPVERGPATAIPLVTGGTAAMHAAGHATLDLGITDEHQLLEALAALEVRGVRIDWAAFHAPHDGRRRSLPTYPFAAERCWLPQLEADARPRGTTDDGGDAVLGARIDLPDGGVVRRIALDRAPRVGELVAATAFTVHELARAIAASADVIAGDWVVLDDVIVGDRFAPPDASEPRIAQLSITPRAADGPDDDAAWDLCSTSRAQGVAPTRHLTGRVRATTPPARSRGASRSGAALERARGGAAFPLLDLIAAAVERAAAAAAGDAAPPSGSALVIEAVFRLRIRRAIGSGPWRCTVQSFPGSAPASATVDLRIHEDGGPVAEITGLKLAWLDPAAARGALTASQRALLHTITWRTSERGAGATPRSAPAGRYVLIGRDGQLARPLATRLASSGVEVTVTLDPVAAEAALPGAALVVDLRAAETVPGAAQPQTLVRDALATARRVVERTGAAERTRLALVTRAAVAVDAAEPVAGHAQAALWGLGRGFAAEYPERWAGLVDLDPTPAPAEVEVLARALAFDDGELESALRGGVRRVPRLVGAEAVADAAPIVVRADAAYVITGGLGALGLAWARWLVDRGAGRIVLVGRKPPDGEAARVVRGLGRVQVAALDITRPDDVRALFDKIDRGGRPLGGVIHAAGVTEDMPLVRIAEESLDRVLAAKITGTMLVAEQLLARPRPELAFVALFSSIAGWLGNPGQAAYAAANAFLDGHAAHLRARGLPAVSLAWGPLAGHGLARDFAAGRRARWGVSALALEDALAVFARAAGATPAAVAVVGFDPDGIAAEVRRGARSSLLADRGQVAAAPAATTATADDLYPALLAQTETVARSVLGLEARFAIPPSQRLDELGMDSMLALDLVEALGHALGKTLPNTLVLDHPTIEAIARYLADL